MRDVSRDSQPAELDGPYPPEQLLPLVYEELRRLAAAKMAQERQGHTLQATALVHEAYLRLAQGSGSRKWEGRGHFFAAAAEAMRRILIENARRRQRIKRGGGLQRVDLDAIDLPLPLPQEDLLALDAALPRLAAVSAQAVEVVKLCFFVGMTQAEAARELGISTSSAERLWSFARAWLFREVEKSRGETKRAPNG